MVSMTLEQAEAFFKKCLGHAFHMYREDYYLYQLYKRLEIPKELEDKWRSELDDPSASGEPFGSWLIED